MTKIFFTAFSRSSSESEVGSLDLLCLEETRGVFVRHKTRDAPVLTIEHEPVLPSAQAGHFDDLPFPLEPRPYALEQWVTATEGPLPVPGLENLQLPLDLSPRQQRERRVRRDHEPAIWAGDGLFGVD